MGDDRDKARSGDLLEGIGDVLPGVCGAELDEGVAAAGQGWDPAFAEKAGGQVGVEEFRAAVELQGEVFLADVGLGFFEMAVEGFLREFVDAGGDVGGGDDRVSLCRRL